MTYTDRLGIGPSELVCFVGAGGKSTLLLRSGAELLEGGHRVLLTTTTKMSPDQIPEWLAVIRPGDPISERGVFMVGGIDGDKVVGVAPEALDAIFESGSVDQILIEADGARRRAFKAPADHEPVIPTATTLVVVIAGLAVLDRPIAAAVHRPERVMSLTGAAADDLITADLMAAVMTHPDGGLRNVPSSARVIAVLTGNTAEGADATDQITRTLGDHPRFERVEVFGPLFPGP